MTPSLHVPVTTPARSASAIHSSYSTVSIGSPKATNSVSLVLNPNATAYVVPSVPPHLRYSLTDYVIFSINVSVNKFFVSFPIFFNQKKRPAQSPPTYNAKTVW